MTIILACLTADHVYQASDRRVTTFDDPTKLHVGGEKNKAVLVEGRVAFGYSGRSEINGLETDDWLAKVIAGGSTSNMGEVIGRIRQEATRAFSRMRDAPAKRCQAFQAVGWFRANPDDADATPGVLLVENALSERLTWLAEPVPEFRKHKFFFPLKRRQFQLFSIGPPLHQHERDAIWRLLRACLRHRSATPDTITVALVKCVQWLSRRHSTVGDNVSTLCIPKRAVLAAVASGTVGMVMGGNIEGVPTFRYFAADGSATAYGPRFVGAGAHFAGITIGPSLF